MGICCLLSWRFLYNWKWRQTCKKMEIRKRIGIRTGRRREEDGKNDDRRLYG